VSTARSIRGYMNRLPAGQIFSTREVLHYGSRASVDQSLYRLVRDGIVVRLAYGLFRRQIKGMKLPSVDEIAIAKAKAFDKIIFVHGKDAGFELGIEESPNRKKIFYVPGSASSSFLCLIQGQRVYFKATAARRLYEGNSRVGRVIRALWQRGASDIDSAVLKKATINLNRDEIRLLRLAAFRVPWWLARFTNHVATMAGKVAT